MQFLPRNLPVLLAVACTMLTVSVCAAQRKVGDKDLVQVAKGVVATDPAKTCEPSGALGAIDQTSLKKTLTISIVDATPTPGKQGAFVATVRLLNEGEGFVYIPWQTEPVPPVATADNPAETAYERASIYFSVALDDRRTLYLKDEVNLFAQPNQFSQHQAIWTGEYADLRIPIDFHCDNGEGEVCTRLAQKKPVQLVADITSNTVTIETKDKGCVESVFTRLDVRSPHFEVSAPPAAASPASEPK